MIGATTGSYNINFDAEYAARKNGARPNYTAEGIGSGINGMQDRFEYSQSNP